MSFLPTSPHMYNQRMPALAVAQHLVQDLLLMLPRVSGVAVVEANLSKTRHSWTSTNSLSLATRFADSEATFLGCTPIATANLMSIAVGR